MEKNKCTTCVGFGLWAIGDSSPMGEMDYRDGCPTKKCPECGAPEFMWTTIDGRKIPLSKLTDDHLDNIIKHIKEKFPKGQKKETLKIMLNEKKKRKRLHKSKIDL